MWQSGRGPLVRTKSSLSKTGRFLSKAESVGVEIFPLFHYVSMFFLIFPRSFFNLEELNTANGNAASES